MEVIGETLNTYRAGTIAIIGRPNTGKSSLLNRLLQRKVSIVSPRSQTTRQRVLGLLTSDQYQIVFVDTPGIQTHYRSRDHQRMNREAGAAMTEVDVLLWVAESGKWTPGEEAMEQQIPQGATVVLVINKVDLLTEKSALLPYLEQRATFPFAALVPVSCRTGHNCAQLLTVCANLLPQQDRLYDPEAFAVHERTGWMSELIREQLLRSLGAEVPYEVTVDVDQDEWKDEVHHVSATLFVARESQKGMLIGNAGQMLKKISTQARLEMERTTGHKTCLHLWVKTRGKHLSGASS